MSEQKTFKAAVIQAASIPTDSMACARKAATLIRQAAEQGARVQVFPEAFLGGYPKGNSFGAPIGMRKPEGRDAFDSMKRMPSSVSTSGRYAD